MNKPSIKYLVLSDIHLGHPRNKTQEIISSLDQFFDHYYARDDLDLIFLAGDVFDRLIDVAEPDLSEILNWIYRLIDFCSRNRIKLRVLEGTPSHDHCQSEMFNAVYDMFKNHVDMKYVKTLSIEFIDDLGISVLYVPDEWNASTDKTLDEVKDLLKHHHIEKVDIACMHGNFAYQLPIQATKAPRHSEEAYLSLVRYFISIGHIHTHSVYERILAQGSFDRLAHGEEEPKGGMEITIRQDGTGEYFFIENKTAKQFKTVLIRKDGVDEAITAITKKARNLPPGSYIRIKAPKDHPAMVGFDEVKRRFPDYYLSKISIEDDRQATDHLIDTFDDSLDYTPITITKENISKLLFEAIALKTTLTSKQHEVCERILKEYTS